MSDESIDYTVTGYGFYEFKTITLEEQRIAAELRRRAQRIVDRVVAEAMENVRAQLKPKSEQWQDVLCPCGLCDKEREKWLKNSQKCVI